MCHPQVYGLLERGAMQRATGTTKMNELSSRSHAVFTSTREADGDEMEQFRGLAPGAACEGLASQRWELLCMLCQSAVLLAGCSAL